MAFTKSSLFTFTLSVLCLFASPILAAENEELALFFDDSDMVEVESRYPKPMSQVSEQVTVFTAEEIERSHVHTIAQFLAEIPGLFVLFSSPDIGQASEIYSLASRGYQTLILVDGVRQNIGSNGLPLINGISPSIVKKIEIIKGPASSVWGSSLGGVINIITKDTGDTPVPTGMVTATFGEGPSHGLTGEVQGKFAKLGYYFNVDHLDSDGLLKDRYTRKEAFYSKLTLEMANDISLGLSYSDSHPRYKVLEFEGGNFTEYVRNHTRFGSLSIDAPLPDNLHLHANLNRFTMSFAKEQDNFSTNANRYDSVWDEAATEGAIRLSWKGLKNSAVLGAETRRGKVDFFYDYWPTASFHVGTPTAREEFRGVYSNASLNFGQLTLSPGIRHDVNSNSGEALNPSLGAIYRLSTQTNIRATIARGFAAPYLWLLTSPFGGNPSLAQEVIWNYQIGIETTYLNYFYITATAFHHRIKDVWDVSNYANNGSIRRHGGELTIKTTPWHNLSLTTAFSAASEDGISYENEKTYAANINLLYTDPRACRAKLTGRYIWYNKFMVGSDPGTYDNFLWDFVIDKEILTKDNYQAEIFMAVHNIFNTTQSWDIDFENPQRWLEAGVTIRF